LQDFLTVSQVAEELRLSRKTIWRFIQEGKIKAYKPAKNYIIMKSELLDFVEKSKYKPLATL
tara:strand:- start:11487 stop:11672 length:186 start_codon:yes stop_codon:yes gene_type:complete